MQQRRFGSRPATASGASEAATPRSSPFETETSATSYERSSSAIGSSRYERAPAFARSPCPLCGEREREMDGCSIGVLRLCCPCMRRALLTLSRLWLPPTRAAADQPSQPRTPAPAPVAERRAAPRRAVNILEDIRERVKSRGPLCVSLQPLARHVRPALTRGTLHYTRVRAGVLRASAPPCTPPTRTTAAPSPSSSWTAPSAPAGWSCRTRR